VTNAPAIAPQKVQTGQCQTGDDSGVNMYSGRRISSQMGKLKIQIAMLNTRGLTNSRFGEK
jgi:hypothetical protein